VRKLAIAASSGDTTPRLLNVLSREGLSARLHIPILPVAAVELVLVAKAIARNSRFLGPPAKVDNAGFLPVDFQPKPHLDLLFDKLLELFARLAHKRGKGHCHYQSLHLDADEGIRFRALCAGR
jgi:hypothetical protein